MNQVSYFKFLTITTVSHCFCFFFLLNDPARLLTNATRKTRKEPTPSNRLTIGSMSDWITTVIGKWIIIEICRTLPGWISFSKMRAKLCDQAFIRQRWRPGSFWHACKQAITSDTKRCGLSWFCDNNFIFQGSIQKRHGYKQVHSYFCTSTFHFKIVILKYFVSNFGRRGFSKFTCSIRILAYNLNKIYNIQNPRQSWNI